MRRTTIGPLFGLRTTLLPMFWLSYLALAVLAGLLAHWLIGLPAGWSMAAGLLSALLLFVCEWLHQFGHSLSARRLGHPMTGIRFFNIFSGSEYPADEPPLPAGTHVRRALGGFWI